MDEVTYDTLKASVQNLKSMFNGWLILSRGLSFIENLRKRVFQSEEAFLCYQKCTKCLWSAFLQVFSHPIRQVTSNAENEWACHIKTMTDSSTSIFSSLKIVFKFIFKYFIFKVVLQPPPLTINISIYTRAVFDQSLKCKASQDSFYWLYSNLSIATFKANVSYVNTPGQVNPNPDKSYNVSLRLATFWKYLFLHILNVIGVQ